MSTYLDDLPREIRADYALCGNQSMFALRHMVRALSMHSHLNTAEENARLAAAKRVLKWNARGVIDSLPRSTHKKG